MNGIISLNSNRSTLSLPQLTASIAGGVCLFAGFMLGMHSAPEINVFRMLKKSTVDYSHLTWIQKDISQKTFQFGAQATEKLSEVNLEFKPYVLPKIAAKKKSIVHSHRIAKKSHSGSKFALLQKRYLELLEKQNPPRDLEFQNAAKSMRENFLVAMNTPVQATPVLVAQKVESAKTVSPAASVNAVAATSTNVEPVMVAKITQASAEQVSDRPVVEMPGNIAAVAAVHQQENDADKTTEVLPAGVVAANNIQKAADLNSEVPVATKAEVVQESAEPAVQVSEASPSVQETVNTEPPSEPNRPAPKPHRAYAAVAIHQKQKLMSRATETEMTLEPIAEVTEVTYPAIESAPIQKARVSERGENLDSQSLTTQNVSNDSIKETVSSADVVTNNSNASEDVDQPIITTNENLSTKDKIALTKALIAQQNSVVAKTVAENKIATPSLHKVSTPKSTTAPVESNTPNPDYAEDVQSSHTAAPAMLAANKTELDSNECNILTNHKFLKPGSSEGLDQNNQICPEHKEWLSKDWNGKGWVKLESSSQVTTITMNPAPNDGATLLLDQNSLTLIAIRAGTKIVKGAGHIVGIAPTGYKVGFTGRAEETQYFESNGKKFFAILNVEPGAGVVELLSDKDQNFSATVFAPIFEDAVTYLDLSTPTTANIGIQVVKSGKTPDPEIVGLTVGVSTQGSSGIQAITQSNGQAVLKNVNVIPGFPIFVDVSSKYQDQASYTYRYELKKQNHAGAFLVNQINEKSIHGWLKQVPGSISDQSAMVVGFYDRRRLDGFKKNYFTKVEPKSEKFGLEPANYSILWDGKISSVDPLEGDSPRFMSVQVPEGLSQVQLLNEQHEVVESQLIPVSPRVIGVVSE